MSAAKSFNSENRVTQPYSPLELVDLRQEHAGLSQSVRASLSLFFTHIIDHEVMTARVANTATETRVQLQNLNGVSEQRETQSALPEALRALQNLLPEVSHTDFQSHTFQVITEDYTQDVSCLYLESPHGDQWLVRARAAEPVPMLLDSLGIEANELRHIRKALSEKRGLISIGTAHRQHLEDWQRAICRELCTPDRSVVSLGPRLLEDFPRIAQSVIPAGERWDQRLWQLASQTDANVIVLADDGTHDFSPSQLGVLADRCLVVQIIQAPDIQVLANRTPSGTQVHRVIMHHAVRCLCDHCSQPHPNPSRVDYGFLDRALPTLSDGVNAWLSASQSTHFKKPSGCDHCASEGYHGEKSVIDAVGDPATLINVAENIDLHAIASARMSVLIEMARGGGISLDEVRRLL